MLAALYVFLAGAVGGLVNALMSDNGFVLPQYEKLDAAKILRPGVIGNALIGAVAAVVSWALYGPVGQLPVLGATAHADSADITLTYAALAGAILVGIGGARWLSDQVDKNLLRAAAGTAAAQPADAAKGKQLLAAALTPVQVLRMVAKGQD